MAELALENIVKRYGETLVVDDLSLKIQDGEFVVLVGPSGCGKSTLLRILAGLLEPTSGTVRIDGKDVTELAPGERDLAMVFQSYALYPHLSVFDNIAFPLRVRGLDKAAVTKKVEHVADMLGLAPLLLRFPRDLSGGQRQRVAMGRAVVREPKAFLFDEPLSNLDASLRAKMRAEIASLHRRLGATTIYVTHDQHEAMTLADRLVLLSQGKIAQEGPPLSVYEQPSNRFAAGFLGSPPMNFLSLSHADGKLVGEGFELDAATYGNVDRMPEKLMLGVRPESFRLVENSGIPATIEWLERTGSDDYLYAKVGEASVVVRLADGTPKLVVGEQVNLAIHKAAMFDAKSGHAVA